MTTRLRPGTMYRARLVVTLDPPRRMCDPASTTPVGCALLNTVTRAPSSTPAPGSSDHSPRPSPRTCPFSQPGPAPLPGPRAQPLSRHARPPRSPAGAAALGAGSLSSDLSSLAAEESATVDPATLRRVAGGLVRTRGDFHPNAMPNPRDAGLAAEVLDIDGHALVGLVLSALAVPIVLKSGDVVGAIHVNMLHHVDDAGVLYTIGGNEGNEDSGAPVRIKKRGPLAELGALHGFGRMCIGEVSL